jgi:hypothetical protein
VLGCKANNPSWNEYCVPLDCASKQWRLIVLRFKRFDGSWLFRKLRQEISLPRDQHRRDDPAVQKGLGDRMNIDCIWRLLRRNMADNGVLCLGACCSGMAAVRIAVPLAY